MIVVDNSVFIDLIFEYNSVDLKKSQHTKNALPALQNLSKGFNPNQCFCLKSTLLLAET